MFIEKVVYFEKAGKENTKEALRIAKDKVLEHGVKKILVASTMGDSALLALDIFKETEIEIMTVGIGTFGWTQDKEKTKVLEEAGIQAYPCTKYLNEEISNSFRYFSEGVKVIIEMATLLVEDGVLTEGEEIVGIAGTVSGADTVLLLKSANIENKNMIHIQRIFCLPIHS